MVFYNIPDLIGKLLLIPSERDAMFKIVETSQHEESEDNKESKGKMFGQSPHSEYCNEEVPSRQGADVGQVMTSNVALSETLHVSFGAAPSYSAYPL